MMERILITGASGFIGYHLIKAALQAGLEVYAAVRPTSDIKHLEHFNIQYTVLDYYSSQALVKELEQKQYSYIIHAAGITKAKHKLDFISINAGYTKNLAKAASEAKINLRKFVFISSLAALGPSLYQDQLPIDELFTAHPVTDYGRSKLLAEKHLYDLKDLPYIILRPTAVYGPREKDIFILLKMLNSGIDPYISSQQQHLSFIYVKDLAKAAIMVLDAKTDRVSFNLSDGNCYDRYALADITKRVLGNKAVRFHLPLTLVQTVVRLLEITYNGRNKMPPLNTDKLNELTAENWNCSIVKVSSELGFTPEYDLDKGLSETLLWYKENKWL